MEGRGGRRFVLWLLALTALLASPFMTIYMGEMLVTRAQFALPLAAAFLGMYAIDGLSERVRRETKAQEQKRTAGVCVWARRLGIVFVSVVLLGQCTIICGLPIRIRCGLKMMRQRPSSFLLCLQRQTEGHCRHSRSPLSAISRRSCRNGADGRRCMAGRFMSGITVAAKDLREQRTGSSA